MWWKRFSSHPRHWQLALVALFSLCAAVLVILPLAPQIIDAAKPEEVILITAFEPFGGRHINSSWEAVRPLNGLHIHGRRIVTLQLPVIWSKAWNPLQIAIDQYHPRLVINVGQGGTNRLELDTSARNIMGKIADNAGIKPISDVITVGGRASYDSKLDIQGISKTLAQDNIAAIVSPNAGTFLCNFISYHSYEYLAQNYVDTATFFVHVPPLASVDNAADQAKLNGITNALKEIVTSASQQVS